MKHACTEQDKLIQSLLDKMHAMFKGAVGPNNRSEYMRQHNVSGIDWHFSLTADDIINQKIPRAVAGCTGIAKVFCKYATDAGLDCVVLITARMTDLADAKHDRAAGNKERIINGHQIVAVRDKNGDLRAFDSGARELKYIKSNIYVGGIIKFRFDGNVVPHLVTAILTPTEYNNIDTYKKLRDVYVNGMDNKKRDFMGGKNKLGMLGKLKQILSTKQND